MLWGVSGQVNHQLSGTHMSERPLHLDYRRPQTPHGSERPGRLFTVLLVLCIFVSLYSISLSVVISRMPISTPQYIRYVKAVQARAATQPAGTPVDWPPFVGQRHTLRSMFSLSVTYFALGISAVTGAMIFVAIRRSCRAGDGET